MIKYTDFGSIDKLIKWQDMLNYEFIASSVILMAAILKIGHIDNFRPYRSLVNPFTTGSNAPPPPVLGHIV